ncbi:MAG: hypothetical protein JSW01_05605 [Candidatus Bathyarchaeota archaeon]|nr:MAG: hypothetical protein JSW01_05605 [Candidatus Bathyarchaeota archaeon]
MERALEGTVDHSEDNLVPLNEYLSQRMAKPSPINDKDFLLTPEEMSDFFGFISSDSKQNAKKLLFRYRNAGVESDWTRGYLEALKGMIDSLGNNGSHTPFLFKIREKDGNGLREIRKEFSQRIERRYTHEYDRGFLTAWVQYLSVLLLYK